MIALASLVAGSRGLGVTRPLLIFLMAIVAVAIIVFGVLLVRRVRYHRGQQRQPSGGTTSLSTSLPSARQPDQDRPDHGRADRGEDARTWEDQGDFADEHSSPTFADEQRGGPERRPEPESPEGYSGMDPTRAADDDGRRARRRPQPPRKEDR